MAKTWITSLFIACVAAVVRIDAKVYRGVTINSPPFYYSQANAGFSVDLINQISQYIKSEFNESFEYSLELTPDGAYGVVKNGTINGMLGQVYNQLADFAVADITITDQRKEFVDFTEPFVEGSLAILVRKEYADGITSIRDLADRTDIPVGCMKGGATFAALSQSTDPAIRRLFERIQKESTFSMRNAEGIERARTSKYAFLLESSTAEYITSFACNLTYIVDQANMFPRQYAIAVPKGADYLPKFNAAINHIKSSGQMKEMWNRYWKENCEILRGVTIESPPYVLVSEPRTVPLSMNGFAVEVMNRIANINGFNYTLYLSPDGKYGFIKNGLVTGMIAEVYIKRADFAVADLTVTEMRRQFVDFTEPFENATLAVLISRETGANISSFADLADSNIPFGTLSPSASYHYMNSSADPVMMKMVEKMKNNPEVLVKSYRIGIEKVKTSRFALIMESSAAEFTVAKDCSLKYIKEDHYPRQYAIALPKDSKHIQGFNSAIRQLKNSGELERLRNEYFAKCQE